MLISDDKSLARLMTAALITSVMAFGCGGADDSKDEGGEATRHGKGAAEGEVVGHDGGRAPVEGKG